MGSGLGGLKILRILSQCLSGRSIHEVGETLVCFSGLWTQRPIEPGSKYTMVCLDFVAIVQELRHDDRNALEFVKEEEMHLPVTYHSVPGPSGKRAFQVEADGRMSVLVRVARGITVTVRWPPKLAESLAKTCSGDRRVRP